MTATLPETITSTEQLDDLLSEPSPTAIEALRVVAGDILILGAGGKMGPTLARMARRAANAAGSSRRVIAVSRFSDREARARLEGQGVETIARDLLDGDDLTDLPDAPNVIYMAGRKFGSQGSQELTWAMNVWLPGRVCERFSRSRIVAFSTGNVYGLVPASGAGSREEDELRPAGEYAMSCVGRERILEHFSLRGETPIAIVRLNYASEMRYGVLVDIARRIHAGDPVSLGMGWVNVIWQGDANAMALAALRVARSPTRALNLAGEKILRVRDVAVALGQRLDRTVRLEGTESPDALLSDGRRGRHELGEPRVGIETLLRWTADWVSRGGESFGKPTRFEVRDGRF